MKRQLPKNVRQIGNVSDATKIYVEDYVDTFMNQLCEKVDQAPIGAFLVGETVHEKEEDYIYVYGAIRMKEIVQKGRDIFINEATWKQGCEQCKQYFGDAEILGWFLTGNGQALETNHNLTKIHQKFFPRENSLFVIKEAREGDEKYFVYKYRNLMESGGHYIYYEKNVEMQDYMIASRKKNGFTPSEIIEDAVTKNFRNVIRDKMEKNETKGRSRYVYVLSTFLVLVVLGAGIAMTNNYEKLQGLKQNLEEAQKPEESIETLGPIVLGDEKDDKEEEKSPSAEVPAEVPAEEPEVSEPETEVKERVYIVKKGDTLASISQMEYGNTGYVKAICEKNGLKDGNLIFVGQKILLP